MRYFLQSFQDLPQVCDGQVAISCSAWQGQVGDRGWPHKWNFMASHVILRIWTHPTFILFGLQNHGEPFQLGLVMIGSKMSPQQFDGLVAQMASLSLSLQMFPSTFRYSSKLGNQSTHTHTAGFEVNRFEDHGTTNTAEFHQWPPKKWIGQSSSKPHFSALFPHFWPPTWPCLSPCSAGHRPPPTAPVPSPAVLSKVPPAWDFGQFLGILQILNFMVGWPKPSKTHIDPHRSS